MSAMLTYGIAGKLLTKSANCCGQIERGLMTFEKWMRMQQTPYILTVEFAEFRKASKSGISPRRGNAGLSAKFKFHKRP